MTPIMIILISGLNQLIAKVQFYRKLTEMFNRRYYSKNTIVLIDNVR